jgi:hypothetical protein
MQRKPIIKLPSLQLFNTDHNPKSDSYVGQFQNTGITLIPLLHSYLIIVPTKKLFEGTYLISKASAIPKNNILDWNSPAPLEYIQFNKLYKVFAKSNDKSFYDIDAVNMEGLINQQTELQDCAFELDGNNIYLMGGYEEPPTDNFIQMIIYNLQKAFSSNETVKIDKALEQAIIVNNIFNK